MIQMSVHGTLANRLDRSLESSRSHALARRPAPLRKSTVTTIIPQTRVPDQDLKHFIEDEQYVVLPHPLYGC